LKGVVVQLSWYPRQQWVQVRHARGDKEYDEPATVFRKTEDRMLLVIPSGQHRLSIYGKDFILNEELLVLYDGESIMVPNRGKLRVRVYDDIEDRWWLFVFQEGNQQINIARWQHEQHWRYVQWEWCMDNHVGPVQSDWVEPKRDLIMELHADVYQKKHQLEILHDVRGCTPKLCWARQSPLHGHSTRYFSQYLDRSGINLEPYKQMVGERYVFWSPQGWAIRYQNQLHAQIVLEKRPSHFAQPWCIVSELYQPINTMRYNAFGGEEYTKLARRSPRFCSWLVRENKEQWIEYLHEKDMMESCAQLQRDVIND